MPQTGDLFPGASGCASLGIDSDSGDAFDITTLAPFRHIHGVSGVFHNDLGNSGILRVNIPGPNGSADIEYSKDGGISYRSLTANSKAITIETPTATEDITLFYTNIPLQVTQLAAVVNNTFDASGVYTIRHDTDRDAAGTEVVTGGSSVTNETSGDVVNIFDAPDVVEDSWIWLETTSISGTVTTQLHVTIEYKET